MNGLKGFFHHGPHCGSSPKIISVDALQKGSDGYRQKPTIETSISESCGTNFWRLPAINKKGEAAKIMAQKCVASQIDNFDHFLDKENSIFVINHCPNAKGFEFHEDPPRVSRIGLLGCKTLPWTKEALNHGDRKGEKRERERDRPNE